MKLFVFGQTKVLYNTTWAWNKYCFKYKRSLKWM